jgi:LytS/YehU family sensor histidine kinase
LVQVVDSGAGLKPGLGTGVGLANVREQLANRFGSRASLRLYQLADQRTCAEVVVPWQTAA